MTASRRCAVVVSYPPTGPSDAIEQHALGLVSELRRRGIAARFERGSAGLLARRSLARAGGWQLIEYMPFAYGRWGAAPGLVAAALLARIVPGAPQLALIAHELFVEAGDGRSWLISSWQRWQLRALAKLAARHFASTQANCAQLQAMVPGSSVTHLPSPSNVPRAARDRDEARALLGLGAEDVALAIFGGRHPSRAITHIEAALAACAAQHPRCVLINLGAQPPDIALPAGMRAIAPGASSGETLSTHLVAADLYLAPFHDGASTRRTTLAAALAHGLAVAATDGSQTDALLRSARSGCVLVPAGDIGRYAEAVLALVADGGERAERGRRGREFYESELSWAVVGERVARALGCGGASSEAAARPGR